MNKNIIQKKMMNSIHLKETVDGVAEKCINSNLRNYQIFGNTVQDGEPAIDNPVEVVSVGELVTEGENVGKYKIPIEISNGKETVTEYIYLTEPLRKIGDYQDYIDFRNRCVIRNCAFQKFNSEQDWMLGNSNSVGNIMYYKLSKNRLGVVDGKVNALLNNCKAVSSSVTTPPANLAPMSVVYGGGNNYMYVFVGNEIASTIAEWKNWLDNNDMHIVYVLSSPTIEDIELPKLPQLKGTTIYQIATNIPSEFVGTYKTRL